MFGEYESSLRNLTQFEWNGLENEEFKLQVEMLKNNIVRNYKEVVQKVDKQSSYFN